MYSRIYKLEGEHVARAETFVCMYYQQAYESVYPNGFLRIYEDKNLVLEEYFMEYIRVDATEAAAGKMVIEFIKNYGKLFLFKGQIQLRIRYDERFTAKLQWFCKENDVTISVTGVK